MRDPNRFQPLTAMRSILNALCQLKANERLVLLCLVRHANARGQAFPEIETVAQETGLGRTAVVSALAGLRESALVDQCPLALVRTQRWRGDGSGGRQSDLYTLGLRSPGESNSQAPLSPHDVPNPAPVASVSRTHGLDPISTPEGGVKYASRTGLGTPGGTYLLSRSDLELPSTPRKASKPKQGKLFEAPPSEHQKVVETYFQEFERVRGEKPPFGAREGKLVHKLIERTGSADKACDAIRTAYADSFFAKTASLLSITNDPARFVGKPSMKQTTGRLVQTGTTPAIRSEVI